MPILGPNGDVQIAVVARRHQREEPRDERAREPRAGTGLWKHRANEQRPRLPPLSLPGEPLYSRDATATYEMLVLSLYGKLNEERAGILEEFRRTKRAYRV